MQNLLDCSIAKDAIDYVNLKNKVLLESLRYRFIYENSIKLSDYSSLSSLSTWYKWYTTFYCKKDPDCLKIGITFCNIYIEEIYPSVCTEPITIEEI